MSEASSLVSYFPLALRAKKAASSLPSAFWVVGFRGMFLFWTGSPLTFMAWERGAGGRRWGRAARVPPLRFPGSYLQQSHLSSHVLVVMVLWWVVSGRVSTRQWCCLFCCLRQLQDTNAVIHSVEGLAISEPFVQTLLLGWLLSMNSFLCLVCAITKFCMLLLCLMFLCNISPDFCCYHQKYNTSINW